jgi:hypothetical protein
MSTDLYAFQTLKMIQWRGHCLAISQIFGEKVGLSPDILTDVLDLFNADLEDRTVVT